TEQKQRAALSLGGIMSEMLSQHRLRDYLREKLYVGRFQRVAMQTKNVARCAFPAGGNSHGERPDQWTATDIRGRPLDAAVVVLARRTWSHWDQIRLRGGAVRRLYGAYQRRGSACLRDSNVGGGRQKNSHDRGP